MTRNATGFPEADARRVAAFTRGVERMPKGRPARRGWRPGQTVRRTVYAGNVAPVGGLWPGVVQEYDADAGTWADIYGADVLVREINGKPISPQRFRGLLCGETDDTPVFAVGCCVPACCPEAPNPDHLYLHYSGFAAPFDFLNGTTSTLNPVAGGGTVGVAYQAATISHVLANGSTVYITPFVSCIDFAGTGIGDAGFYLFAGLPITFKVPAAFCDPDQFGLDTSTFCGTYGERAFPGPRRVGGNCYWGVNVAHDLPTFPTGPLYVPFKCGGTRPIDVTSATVAMYFIDISLITLPCLNCVPNCPDGIVTRSTGTVQMNETP